MKVGRVLPILWFAVVSIAIARGDVFNMGGTRDPVTGQWTGSASLEFVTVGDPRNAADTRVMNDGTSGYGAVSYTYQIGKYDITVAQDTSFLDAIGRTDPYHLGTDMPGITRTGSSGSYSYNIVPGAENLPVGAVSWGSAVRFANWLENGQPTGTLTGDPVADAGLTEDGSYDLAGGAAASIRKPGAKYVVPSESEWYKAAYYKGGSTNAGYWLYPTRSDSKPRNVLSATGTNNANYFDFYGTGTYSNPGTWLTEVGAFAASPGPYGTFDMGGNVWEWNEAISYYGAYAHRGLRGGAWDYFHSELRADERAFGGGGSTGFRVALVPEPASLVLLALSCLLVARRR